MRANSLGALMAAAVIVVFGAYGCLSDQAGTGGSPRRTRPGHSGATLRRVLGEVTLIHVVPH